MDGHGSRSRSRSGHGHGHGQDASLMAADDGPPLAAADDEAPPPSNDETLHGVPTLHELAHAVLAFQQFTGTGAGGTYTVFGGNGAALGTFTILDAAAGAGGDDGVGVGEGAYRDGGFGAVPASREAIDGLPEAAAGDEAVREASCAVCLESLVEEEGGDGDGDGGSGGGVRIRKMPCCSHGFHERCISDWLRVSRLCPCCRFALPAAADDDDDLEEGEVRGFRPYALHEDDGEDDLEEAELRDSSGPQYEDEDDDDEMEEGELRDSSGPYEDEDNEEEGDLEDDDELADSMEHDHDEEEEDDDAYGDMSSLMEMEM